ncbi:MAG: 50S ribosomal protein L9 [Patescibacteria group bacterium]
MKIILLKETKGLGHAGEIKEVKVGYALNFLIPEGFADMATKHSLNVLKAQENKLIKSKEVEKKSKKAEAKKIDGKFFEVIVKADEKGTMYAKLDAKAVAKELEKEGYKIEAGEIRLDEPIKKIGEYEVGLELGGQKAKIKLEVGSEKEGK